jgi:hypothetical protein
LIGGPQSFCQKPLYKRLGQVVKDKGSVFVAFYHTSFAQHPQLLRDVHLRPPQSGLEMTYTRLTLAQLVQDAQPGRVRKYTEQLGCLFM